MTRVPSTRGRPRRTDARMLWVAHLPKALHREARTQAKDHSTLGDWLSSALELHAFDGLIALRTHPRAEGDWRHVRFQMSPQADARLQALLAKHDVSRAGLLYSILRQILAGSPAGATSNRK